MPPSTSSRDCRWRIIYGVMITRCLAGIVSFVSGICGVGADEPDPRVTHWEPAIAAFETADTRTPPPKGANLFVGSSSIRLWNLDEYFPEHLVVNRGFGGSHVSDSLHFADRLILPHAPRVVLVYAGDNDIAARKTPERVANDYRLLVEKIHAALPGSRIVYICIKPSLARWKLVDEIREANRQIKAFTASDERLDYADIFSPMLGNDGQPREELFVDDGLHLNPEGYRVWAEVLRPLLVRPE